MTHMKDDSSGPLIRRLLHRAEWMVTEQERRVVREKYGLVPSDFRVLISLLNHGPIPVSVIGRKVLLTSGSTTTAIDRLEKRGFVVRGRDPGDRRISVIELSQVGRELVEVADVEHAELMENVVSALSDAEKSQLANILRKLTK